MLLYRFQYQFIITFSDSTQDLLYQKILTQKVHKYTYKYMYTIHGEELWSCSRLILFSYTEFIKNGICLSYGICTTRCGCIHFLL